MSLALLVNGPEGLWKLDTVLSSTVKKGESGMFQRVMVWVIGGLVFEEGEGVAEELVFDGE
ncbi:MAG: hypothetical protein NTV08_18540, partial [Verrucomicrobia bacterium]|nr:hypothetical protein [Verrucomicrobiota bacterium]